MQIETDSEISDQNRISATATLGASPTQSGQIPPNRPATSQRLGVLLMIAAGCLYAYFSIPDAEQDTVSASATYHTAETPDSVLKRQYEQYRQSVEAVNKISSADSASRLPKNSVPTQK